MVDRVAHIEARPDLICWLSLKSVHYSFHVSYINDLSVKVQ